MKLAYRPDLDGLRAIAVAGVVIYHFFPTLAVGGFTGVDVFFVLSGFLITSIVVREIDAGTFSLLGFYDRRVRRIFPALFAMVLFTLVAAWLLFLPDDFLPYAKSLAAIPLFVTNLVFYREAGYFNAASEMKPLLHTWSLSIEEQFYVFFPLCAVLVARYARRFLLHILIAGTVLSFALNVLLIEIDKQPAAFFTLPTRAWELLLGAALAELMRSPRQYLFGQAAQRAAGYIGLALILAGFFFVDDGSRFPGWHALLPTVGAALVVWSGGAQLSGNSLVSALLSSPPFVWLGLISYSLYLWHWPLLVFAKYYTVDHLTPAQTTLVLLASIAMAALSYRYVERPFRFPARKIAPWRSVSVGVSALALAGAAGLFVLVGRGLPQRFDPGVIDLATATKGVGLPRLPFSTGARIKLVGPDDEHSDIVLWGDSHANAISPAIAEVSRSNNLTAALLTMPGCLPATVDVAGSKEDCKAFARDVTRWIRDTANAKVVVLAGRWSAYPRWWQETMPQDQGLALLEQSLVATVEDLRRHGKWVVVIGEVPMLAGWAAPSVLARIKRYGLGLDIRPDEQGFIETQKPYAAILDRVARDGATVLYPQSRLCAGGKCEVVKNSKALYFDDDHVSTAGALELVPLFAGLPALAGSMPATSAQSPADSPATR